MVVPVVPVNPNSRKGRIASPLEQGRVTMEHTTVVGIDVSKDRPDVHVLPSGEVWAVNRDADGLAELCCRLAGMSGVVALEATGGTRTSSPPACRALAFPCSWSTPRRCGPLPERWASAQDRSDRRPGDRPLCRGDQAGGAAVAGPSEPHAGGSAGAPSPDRRDDGLGEPAAAAHRHAARAQEHRAASGRSEARTRRHRS